MYVPLRSYLAVARKELIPILEEDNSAIADSFFEHLSKKTLINPYELHQVITRIASQISIPVTDNCNLKCKYCYFRAGDADKKACQSKEEIKCYVDAYLKRLSAFQIRNKENTVDVSPLQEVENLQ